jgi:SIR2-like domain
MISHDPRREVEKLREQLGTHDGTLTFLVGAGASCAAKGTDGAGLIPAIAEMTGRCEQAVAEFGSGEWAAYAAVAEERATSLGRPANVEDVLSRVRTKLSAMVSGDTLAGASHIQLEKIEETIRTTIADAARPAEDRIPAVLPHHSLARWISRLERASPIEIFTTNYDTLLERALEDERVAVFDGFTGSRRPYFLPISMTHAPSMPGNAWTRLWKLHGSVNWSWEDFSANSSRRIVRGVERGDGEVIFPSLHKYDESRKQPYLSMLDRLTHILERPAGAVLVVVGYSFGDEHINEIIFDALEAHDRTHVIALQYQELDDEHELMSRASRRRNLLVYGPTTAVVAGERRPWALADPVDDRTAELLDIPFDSDAAPEPDSVATGGRFRLGDFNYFAQFLDSISGDDD